jgi:hypothetical protein
MFRWATFPQFLGKFRAKYSRFMGNPAQLCVLVPNLTGRIGGMLPEWLGAGNVSPDDHKVASGVTDACMPRGANGT